MTDFFLQNQDIIYIVILSILLGIEVISHVPAILHTPLMSGANAIHGVVIIGAIIVMGHAHSGDYLALILGFLAVFTRHPQRGRRLRRHQPDAGNV